MLQHCASYRLILTSVRGYLPSNAEVRKNQLDLGQEQESIRELAQRRSALLLELNNYAQNSRVAAANQAATRSGMPTSLGGALGQIANQVDKFTDELEGMGRDLGNTLLSELNVGGAKPAMSKPSQPVGGTIGPGGVVGRDLGVIPAQTQLSTALAINLGTEGKAVSSSQFCKLLQPTELYMPIHVFS